MVDRQDRKRAERLEAAANKVDAVWQRHEDRIAELQELEQGTDQTAMTHLLGALYDLRFALRTISGRESGVVNDQRKSELIQFLSQHANPEATDWLEEMADAILEAGWRLCSDERFNAIEDYNGKLRRIEELESRVEAKNFELIGVHEALRKVTRERDAALQFANRLRIDGLSKT